MIRRLSLPLFLSILIAVSGLALAQDNPRLQPGDPPRASLISVSEPDDEGIVTVTGAQNSVFPTAQVGVRNLYTNETVYVTAGINGTFEALLRGVDNTPYLISPAQGTISAAQRESSVSLPGGPAVIVTAGEPRVEGEGARFNLSGAVGSGDQWRIEAVINQTRFNSDDPTSLNLRLMVTMPQPTDAAIAPTALRFIGRLELQPIAVQNGETLRAVGAQGGNNGWSGILTASGLPIDDIAAPIQLAEVAVNGGDGVVTGDGLSYTMTFEQRIPSSFLNGLYVPVLRLFVRQGDEMPQPWETSTVYGGDGVSSVPAKRLPVVLNIGGVEDVPLPFALLLDAPSDGARGTLPVESGGYALSSRVRYQPETYILPPNNADGEPIPYSLEPYLPMQLFNSYRGTGVPLIPLALPSGQLVVNVRAPDGSSFATPGALPITQNTVGTAATDEQTLYGAQSPLDFYQLTTFDPSLRRYTFAQYGEHTITLAGEVEDIYGNRYIGGGEYRVLIAEPLDLRPAVLSGTSFMIGDVLNTGLTLAPSIAADVTVHVRVYPLDGADLIEQVYEGTTNVGGYYNTGESFIFTSAGEYVIDYEARYTDAAGRLWAGSARSAGVIGGESSLVARGARGLHTPNVEPRQAWYNATQVLANAEIDADEATIIINTPYQSGDVAWLPDGADRGLAPMLRLHDVLGDYERWLLDGASTDASALGTALRNGAALDELPAAILGEAASRYNPASAAPPASTGYAYLSAVSPSVSLRQFVIGTALPTLPTWVGMDDPLNGQIGAGYAGMQPGDVVFVFGGALVGNTDADVLSASIYGSAVIITDSADPLGARVSPPARGADGGADGGALLTLDGTSYDAFFLPTGVPPGTVLTEGDTFALSGQVAPALAAGVNVRVTAPDGVVREYNGRANPVGYFYDPALDFVVDQVGVWSVNVVVSVDAQTSAGISQPPYPQGGILGAADGHYIFYVIPADAQPIPVTTRPDITIPSALQYNFNLNLPSGWESTSVNYMLTAPGYLLEQGTLRPGTSSFSYSHNPTDINRSFPNIELEGRVDGIAGSDPQQFTLFVQATDENGAPRTLYRIYTFFHDRLISLQNGEGS
jgi:hypothetical protein